MSKVSAHVFVSGKVQGVFYRVWTKSNAKDLCLAGWVRNTDDGRVEAVFEGDKEKVEEMIQRMREGPDMSNVDNVDFTLSEDLNEDSDFIIKT